MIITFHLTITIIKLVNTCSKSLITQLEPLNVFNRDIHVSNLHTPSYTIYWIIKNKNKTPKKKKKKVRWHLSTYTMSKSY